MYKQHNSTDAIFPRGFIPGICILEFSLGLKLCQNTLKLQAFSLSNWKNMLCLVSIAFWHAGYYAHSAASALCTIHSCKDWRLFLVFCSFHTAIWRSFTVLKCFFLFAKKNAFRVLHNLFLKWTLKG